MDPLCLLACSCLPHLSLIHFSSQPASQTASQSVSQSVRLSRTDWPPIHARPDGCLVLAARSQNPVGCLHGNLISDCLRAPLWLLCFGSVRFGFVWFGVMREATASTLGSPLRQSETRPSWPHWRPLSALRSAYSPLIRMPTPASRLEVPRVASGW